MTLSRTSRTCGALAVAIASAWPLAPLRAAPYQLGTCVVSQSAPASCDRGKSATGVYPGTQHADCTNAKTNAARNLMSGIPANCGNYVTCTAPCRVIQK
jgi:hypothetical protein